MERVIIAYHPGEHIKEELWARGRSQKQFAELLGVAPNEVNDLIKGRRNITAVRAMRIGKAFGQSAEMRLWIQNYYDIYLASRNKQQLKLVQEIWVRREAMAFA
jgi:HTH-type transcriptional regulator/antitoxin HigA